MDPDVSVLLECAVWRGLAEAETDAALESHIEEVWAKRVTREPWLFNGSKFRLHSFTFDSSKAPMSRRGRSEAGPRLTLRLGLTSYKDFLGTNWSERAGALRRRGETELNDPCGLLAQPLGVGGVLCTSDGKVVLIRRSQRVAEAGGLLDIPGGHPEPQVRNFSRKL
uniref:Uncharacterized protein n=1 Tax=Gadus morhua TaxID=8049 RepID=A0A8C5CT47_GADMO